MHTSFKDNTGQVFGRLKVFAYLGVNKHRSSLWACSCVCGNNTVVTGSNLQSKHTASCGCIQREGNNYKHGHNITRKRPSRTYTTWYNMKQRCLNPNLTNYEYYGERGISVCDRWRDSFINFLEDMGIRPENTSIDRINVEGNYEVSNCRWATPKGQANNRRMS